MPFTVFSSGFLEHSVNGHVEGACTEVQTEGADPTAARAAQPDSLFVKNKKVRKRTMCRQGNLYL